MRAVANNVKELVLLVKLLELIINIENCLKANNHIQDCHHILNILHFAIKKGKGAGTDIYI